MSNKLVNIVLKPLPLQKCQVKCIVVGLFKLRQKKSVKNM